MSWTFILAVLTGIIYPAYILLTYRKINTRIRQDKKFRLVDYKQTAFIFWALTLLILGNYFASHPPQFSFYPKFTLLNAALIVLVLAFAYFQYRSAKIPPGSSDAIKAKLKDVYYYLPKTVRELNWFIFLSVSAGICEEIIFRLFLFGFLKENSNLIIAFIVTNFIFAITHISSGKNNIISSFVLGVLFSVIYYFTDNIWIAILLHIVIDISAGIIGYRINQNDERANALQENTP